MRIAGCVAGLLMGCAVLAPEAGAATITGIYEVSNSNFAPGAPVEPVHLKFDISYDPDVALSKDTGVITLFSSNITFSGPIYFTNIPGLGSYLTGAFSANFHAGDNNFIYEMYPDSSPFSFSYSQTGAAEVYTGNHFDWSLVTPIPGSALMLLTALGALRGLTMFRGRAG